jgi:sugar lactone lactonase YvrE
MLRSLLDIRPDPSGSIWLDNMNNQDDDACRMDMAESMLLGYHILCRLGWIDVLDPSIRRTDSVGVILAQHKWEESISIHD